MNADHDVLLRRPAFLGRSDAPAILRRLDQEFVRGLLRDLGSDEARPGLTGQQLPAAGDRVLYRPVHRAFHLLVVEAVCDVPGNPRLDPRKIESAGFVLRRTAGSRREGWFTRDGVPIGWAALADPSADPDPIRRHAQSLGHPELDRRRRVARPRTVEAEEAETRLFPAPPAVCEAAGSTILYGVVGTDEPVVAEAAVVSIPAANPAELNVLLPPWLRGSGSIPPELAGGTFRCVREGGRREIDVRSGDTWVRSTLPDPSSPGRSTPALEFLRMLVRLRAELRAFDPGTPVNTALARVSVTLPDGSHSTLVRALADACDVLVLRETGRTITLPAAWPTLPADVLTSIRTGAQDALQRAASRHAAQESRFARADARYVARAFIRVRRSDGCPPRLHWSAESPDFRVARWFEPGPDGALIPELELPEINRNFLKNLRPNVSIRVPTGLFNLLRDNLPGDLLDGKGRESGEGSPDFVWICSFNLSILFVIAFVVMITFLILLNIVFWWLPFVKICIPLPRR